MKVTTLRRFNSRKIAASPAGYLGLAAAGLFVLSGSAHAVTYVWNAAATPLNWSSLANWSNTPTGNGPTGAGNIVNVTANGAGSVITVLDNPGIIIGQIQNLRGGSRNWDIGANGSFAPITMNNTGGSLNTFGNSNAAISAGSSGNISVLTSIIIAGTDLDFGSTSNTNHASSSSHILGTLGSTSINSSDVSGTRNLNLRNNAGAIQTGSVGLLVNSAIGSVNSGSAIAVNNLSTTLAAGVSTVTLAGPIGGNTGVGASVSISNTATSTRGFVISGVLGQTVTGVTQNSATSSMTLSGANTNYSGATAVNGGTLRITNAAALGSSNVTINGGTLTSSLASSSIGGNLTLTTGILDTRETLTGAFSLASDKSFTMSGGTWALLITNLSTFDSISSLGGTLNTFSVGGTLNLTGSTLVVGNYSILTGFTSGSGSFASITGYDPALFNVTFNTATAGVGQLVVTAIPEAREYGIGMGALLFAVVAFRRRQARLA